MTGPIEIIMGLFVITSLLLLGSSRLLGCIRLVAIQGVLLGLLPFFVHGEGWMGHRLFLSLAMLVLKGVVFPLMLARAMRGADVRREVEPSVGYGLSLWWGAAAFVVALWIGRRLPLAYAEHTSFIVSVAFFTIFVGLFLIVSRKKAITQVLGYLTLENGIYAFGVALAHEEPLLIELGILLDVFVAVFVMGIMIFHINREFDHIDSDKLSVLKE
jgi:hydrogenase-4 component E